MYYQVVMHDTPTRTWRRYASPVTEWEMARRMGEVAAANHSGQEVHLLMAPTLPELDQKFLALERGVQPKVVSLPNDVSPEDRVRFLLEDGSGGDTDHPYLFGLPQEVPVWSRWLALWRRYTRGEIGGANDGQ